MKVKHYLLSMPLADGMHAHCYVMSNDPGIVKKSMNKMLYEVEQRGMELGRLPMVMATVLADSGIAAVRKHLEELYEDAAELLKTATDFHMSVWMQDDRSAAALLALH